MPVDSLAGVFGYLATTGGYVWAAAAKFTDPEMLLYVVSSATPMVAVRPGSMPIEMPSSVPPTT